MCWSCDNPTKTTTDFLAEVVEPEIDARGWHVQAVLGSRRTAPFAYTVGLTALGLPELVVTGLPHLRSVPMIHVAARRWVLGDDVPVVGRRLRLRGLPVEVLDVAAPEEHLFMATALYGDDDVRAQQLVWADARGRWPWEVGHRASRRGQPLLGPRVP